MPRPPSINGQNETSDVESNPRRNERKRRMLRVRRTFLLFVTFDLIFMILLWIIYNQINGKPITQAFEDDVIHFSIYSSLFDVVSLSILRFIILMIFYALLQSSHWIFVGFTTLGTTGFIVAKTCIFTISKTNKSFTDYIILIVSFILAWIEIWFFDSRLIPLENRLNEEHNNDERRPLLSPTGSRSSSPIPTAQARRSTNSSELSQRFYSPEPSDDGETSDDQNPPNENRSRSNTSVSDRTNRSTETVLEDPEELEAFQQRANDIVREVMQIYQIDQGWGQEARSSDGMDVVESRNFPKIGKVFRLSSFIPAKRDDIVQMLFEHQDDMPKWSPTVLECRVLQWINRDLYISYQMTSEQAQGVVAKRDFVNLTMRRKIDDLIVLGAQACQFSKMPPIETCVRGENGPTAYILKENGDNSTKITWLLNVNLKGWLPQYLINSSLANVQLTLIQSMRNHLRSTELTSSFSSSNGGE